MPHAQVTIYCDRSKARTVEYALTKLQADAITLSDAADHPILEPALGEQPLWPNTKVAALFDEHIDQEYINTEVAKRCPDCCQGTSWQVVTDKAWERVWLDDYRPIDCGHGLWIVPSDLSEAQPAANSHQEVPQDIQNPGVDDMPSGEQPVTRVTLDPGLAFGTGTHPTTKLCLRWLATQNLQGARVLDYGCGSGILAIAALARGASYACGIDIDPQALTASRENAKRNGIEDSRFDLLIAESASQGDSRLEQEHSSRATEDAKNDRLAANAMRESFDIVFANILAGPLVQLRSVLARRVAPGGYLCLSGITEDQVAELRAAYQDSFILIQVDQEQGWACLIMQSSK